jgi:hypothetical protein
VIAMGLRVRKHVVLLIAPARHNAAAQTRSGVPPPAARTDHF